MIKQERHTLICDGVQAIGRVHVRDLAERLDVSEMTIRRDLEELEERGELTRVHGGAISNRSRSYEPGFAARTLKRTDAKRRIGAAAAALLRDGETLILDAGTTTVEVANALPADRRLRILALSLFVADIVADLPNVTLMIPGGVVRRHERSFIGGMTTSTFANLEFDTVILTSGGVDVDAGVTEYEFDDSETKIAALKSARRIIVVADSSKLGAVAFVRLCPIGAVDIVVTDSDAPTAIVDALRALDIDVIVA